MPNNGKICLIAGVGPGTGRECAKKFSENGYKIAMLARNLEFLNNLEKKIPNTKSVQNCMEIRFLPLRKPENEV